MGRPLNGIGNFDEVQACVIYRGAQPERAAIKSLERRGVRTVINLRHDPRAWEEKSVIDAQMSYVWVPMFASDVKPAQVEIALHAIESAQRPIFIHCRFGCDRTGLAIGAYRIVDQKWSADRAVKELYDHGYHWALYPGIERYLRTLEERPQPGD